MEIELTIEEEFQRMAHDYVNRLLDAYSKIQSHQVGFSSEKTNVIVADLLGVPHHCLRPQLLTECVTLIIQHGGARWDALEAGANMLGEPPDVARFNSPRPRNTYRQQ